MCARVCVCVCVCVIVTLAANDVCRQSGEEIPILVTAGGQFGESRPLQRPPRQLNIHQSIGNYPGVSQSIAEGIDTNTTGTPPEWPCRPPQNLTHAFKFHSPL